MSAGRPSLQTPLWQQNLGKAAKVSCMVSLGMWGFTCDPLDLLLLLLCYYLKVVINSNFLFTYLSVDMTLTDGRLILGALPCCTAGIYTHDLSLCSVLGAVMTFTSASDFLFLLSFFFWLRYGRVYATAADPYHHSVGPTTTYGVGTMVSWVKTCKATVDSHVCSMCADTCCPASVTRPVCTEEDTTASPRTKSTSGGGGWRLNGLSRTLGLTDLWMLQDRLWDLQLWKWFDLLSPSRPLFERLNRLKL